MDKANVDGVYPFRNLGEDWFAATSRCAKVRVILQASAALSATLINVCQSNSIFQSFYLTSVINPDQ